MNSSQYKNLINQIYNNPCEATFIFGTKASFLERMEADMDLPSMIPILSDLICEVMKQALIVENAVLEKYKKDKKLLGKRYKDAIECMYYHIRYYSHIYYFDEKEKYYYGDYILPRKVISYLFKNNCIAAVGLKEHLSEKRQAFTIDNIKNYKGENKSKEETAKKIGVPLPETCYKLDWEFDAVYHWAFDKSSGEYVLNNKLSDDIDLTFYALAPQVHEIAEFLPEKVKCGISKLECYFLQCYDELSYETTDSDGLPHKLFFVYLDEVGRNQAEAYAQMYMMLRDKGIISEKDFF